MVLPRSCRCSFESSCYVPLPCLKFRILSGPPGHIRVHSLIVMTISDVETLTSSQDPIDLVAFLRDYSTVNPERMRSIHNVAAITPRYAEKWSWNRKLREAYEDLIEAARAYLFPEKQTL
jgi:hypothetical protein